MPFTRTAIKYLKELGRHCRFLYPGNCPIFTPGKAETRMMKLLARIPPILKNKYLLTGVGFLVWMLFFDERDFITTFFKQRQELRALEKSEKYYNNQIATTKTELDKLKSNPSLVEKYARERYLMKRDNEDLFLIREK
jgi:cell division protein DivIC